ncbi:MAG TPA: helix-turn-helix transcriptional regulator [Streptosporangiaceae bacterium]|nr:helix-turn-helix transcriptional regulator [Streptosporangiaceae bacterium]
MPDPRSSAIRRGLAAELRRLREQAGLSGDDVAQALGWSASKVSRIETHRTGVKVQDLPLLLDLYAVDAVQRRQLIALAGEQNQRGWWAAYADALPDDYLTYIGLEDSAVSLQCWSPEIVHGLLQTEAYSAEMMRAHFSIQATVTPNQAQRRIESRMRRQQILTRGQPEKLSFILDEATLLHRFGTPAVMREQLARLVELAQLPAVTLQILAFAGDHPIGPGGFTILSFDPVHGTALDDVVYVEQLTSSSFVEEDPDTFQYKQAFGRLAAEALDPHASRELIEQIAIERWS